MRAPAGWMLAALLLARSSPAVAGDPALEAFLSRWAVLSPAERRSVEEGRIVARMLEVSDPKDVACVAVLRVPAPKSRLLEWLTGPEGRRGGSVLAAGEITGAGDGREVAALVVGTPQADELRDCRPGDCEMKLPAQAIQELDGLRDPSRRVTSEAASVVLRGLLRSAAEAYRRQGRAGLLTYADGPRPVRVRDALEGLRTTGPDRASAGRLLWSQEKLWKRIVISLDHELVDEPSAADAVVLSTRVFANHYFEGAYSLTALHETPAGSYVVFLNHSRSDHRDGGFSRLERPLVSLLVRRRIRGQWQDIREGVASPRREVERAAARGRSTPARP